MSVADAVSEEKLKLIVREAVGSAVMETLITLGIDVRDPIRTQEQMASLRELAKMLDDEEFKKDLAHVRRWRKSLDEVSNIGVKTAVGIIITGLFGMVVFSITEWVRKNGG